MTNVTFEIKRTQPGYVLPKGNFPFEAPSQASPGITYDAQNNEIIFEEPGLYLVKWWVATETASRDAIEFALVLLQDSVIERIPGCSPIKTGQVSGFGAIDIKATGAKLALANATDIKAVLAIDTSVKAYLLIIRINPEYSSGLIGVYHTNLSTSGSYYEVTIGHVVYRLQYYTSSAIAMYVKSTEGTVTVDIKRSSQVDSGVNGSSRDNYALTTAAQNMDTSISTASNEMHRTWIRQQDPDSGLWSLHEVELFPSAGGARISICVYLIYENIDLSGL